MKCNKDVYKRQILLIPHNNKGIEQNLNTGLLEKVAYSNIFKFLLRSLL